MRNRLRRFILSFLLKPVTVDVLLTQIGFFDKLRALLQGLEIENIKHLLETGDVEEYRMLGKTIASKIKKLEK